jgi:uncharacterized protein YecT (DUF1311 family)
MFFVLNQQRCPSRRTRNGKVPLVFHLTLHRLILRRLGWLRLIGLLSAALLVPNPVGMRATAAEPAAVDRAALAACLDLVKKNRTARGVHDPDELTEKPGPAGRLAAAAAGAPRKEESCIGIVSTTCIQAEGNESNAVTLQCYGREADAWDGRLNSAYKALLARGDSKEVEDGLRKTQRNWIAFRDAACAQPAVVFQGTMAGPMSARCVLELTARQALWLEGWLQ